MANPDFDKLREFLLPFAQNSLARHGEFFPFGAVVKTNGELSPQAFMHDNERPSSKEVIAMLYTVFCQQAAAGELTAIGICFNAPVIPPGKTDKVDAICLQLEHRQGESVKLCLPYHRSWFKLKYDTLYATETKNIVFQSVPPNAGAG